MKYVSLIILSMFVLPACITEYIPGLKENDELIVVEGLITDQPVVNTVNIYRTLAIWTRDWRTPIKKCTVWITDDTGNSDTLRKVEEGKYATDPEEFIGVPGRTYTLHFTSLEANGLQHYESTPVKMIPVPPIDSMYYEKNIFYFNHLDVEGCQIYVDTYDPSSECSFYRWDYKETWELRLPFPDAINRICWGTQASNEILIKNTSMLNEDRVTGFPMRLIRNPVDRLGIKYSLNVNQYSLTEDEYNYWERLQNTLRKVGGLYDIVPSSVTGNVYCLENKYEKVLGYFSVSAVKSRRYFITDHFRGFNAMYLDCIDSISIARDGIEPWAGNNTSWWLLYDYIDSVPSRRILTNKRECGDCTSRGTNIRPPFWDDYK